MSCEEMGGLALMWATPALFAKQTFLCGVEDSQGQVCSQPLSSLRHWQTSAPSPVCTGLGGEELQQGSSLTAGADGEWRGRTASPLLDLSDTSLCARFFFSAEIIGLSFYLAPACMSKF